MHLYSPYTPSWPSQGQPHIYLYFLYRTETWSKETRWNDRKRWQERRYVKRNEGKKWQKEGTVTRLMEDTVALKRFSLPPLLFSLYHPTTVPYPFLPLHVVVLGQIEEAWEPSKKHCSFGYRAVLDSKVPSTFRTVCTCVDQAQHVASRWAAR